VESELHDDAPKRVAMHHAAIVETTPVKGFYPETERREGNHNDAPKRVTTPAGIVAIGAEALSFFPKKPSHHFHILKSHAVLE
jgi:hypothetical protein